MAVWGVLIHEGQSKTCLEAKAWKARVHPLMIFLDFYYAWKCGQVICADICISNSGVSYLNDRVVQCVQQRDHTHEGLCFENLPVKKQFKFKNLLWRNRSANKTRTCGAEMRGTYLAVQPLYLFPPLLSMASLGWAPEAQHNSLLAFHLLSAPYSSASVYECMVAIEALWIPPRGQTLLVRVVITLFALPSEVMCCWASKQFSSSLSTSWINKVLLEGLLSSFFWRVHRSFPAECETGGHSFHDPLCLMKPWYPLTPNAYL